MVVDVDKMVKQKCNLHFDGPPYVPPPGQCILYYFNLRIVAETHYQLGVALGFNSQFEKAMKSLITAIKIIEERIKNIKEGVKKGLIRRKDVIKEFNELEALIPEIYEKIADTKSMQEAVHQKLKRVMKD